MLSTLIRRREEEGFTLVELMVVILIIAILIGAAIPTFLGLRSRAQDSAAKQDLRNTLTAAKAAAVETEGVYNASVLSQLQDIEPAITFEEKNLDSGTVRDAAEDDAVVVDVVGSEFVALRESQSGRVFIAVDSNERGSAIELAADKGDNTTVAEAITAAFDADDSDDSTPPTSEPEEDPEDPGETCDPEVDEECELD